MQTILYLGNDQLVTVSTMNEDAIQFWYWCGVNRLTINFEKKAKR